MFQFLIEIDERKQLEPFFKKDLVPQNEKHYSEHVTHQFR